MTAAQNITVDANETCRRCRGRRRINGDWCSQCDGTGLQSWRVFEPRDPAPATKKGEDER